MTPYPTYLDTVARTLGLHVLPQATRNALIEEIDTLVFRAVLFRVLSELDNDEKDELHDVLDQAGDDFQKPYSFLKEKVKNFDAIVDDELRRVKEETQELMEQFI